MSKVKATLAAGIVLIAGIGALTLTRSPPRVLRLSGPPANSSLGVTIADPAICQAEEVLPADVSAIRLPLIAFFGSKVHVVLYSGSQVLAEGSRGPDWTGTSVTVPVKPVAHATSNVKLCFALGPNGQKVIIPGHVTPVREAAVALTGDVITPQARVREEQPLRGRLVIEYLSSGEGSWWSRILTVARHVGIGRAFSGTWIALLIAALMTAAGVLAVRLTLRELP